MCKIALFPALGQSQNGIYRIDVYIERNCQLRGNICNPYSALYDFTNLVLQVTFFTPLS